MRRLSLLAAASLCACMSVTAAAVDLDGDMVLDGDDACPRQGGYEQYAGCPALARHVPSPAFADAFPSAQVRVDGAWTPFRDGAALMPVPESRQRDLFLVVRLEETGRSWRWLARMHGPAYSDQPVVVEPRKAPVPTTLLVQVDGVSEAEVTLEGAREQARRGRGRDRVADLLRRGTAPAGSPGGAASTRPGPARGIRSHGRGRGSRPARSTTQPTCGRSWPGT